MPTDDAGGALPAAGAQVNLDDAAGAKSGCC